MFQKHTLYIRLFEILKLLYPPKGLCKAEPNGVHFDSFHFIVVWEGYLTPSIYFRKFVKKTLIFFILFDGMDGMGWDSIKSVLNFYTFWIYREGDYLLIHVILNYHQHSYRFQNLMSSWGWGNKISKFEQVGDFSICGSGPVIFYT